MARIIPVQTKASIQQEETASGNFYPMCIWANEEFLHRFEDCLIVAKTLLEPDTQSSDTVDNIQKGLSNYKVHKAKLKEDLPTEIEQHFGLLPNINASIDMVFKPHNNVPTEALLYSFDEVQGIANALSLAMEKADHEQSEAINPFNEAFNGFLASWIENKERTGSLFAEKTTK